MKSIQIAELSSELSNVKLLEVERPQPGQGEILVRMLAAPINPSDFNYIDGTYQKGFAPLVWNQGDGPLSAEPGGEPFPQPPYALGAEGVGVVEAAGGGFLAKRLVGKRVAVASGPPNGTWQEFTVVDAQRAVPVPKSLSDEQACSFFVNPLTALVMVRDVLRVPRGAWLLQTAAGSALAGMVRNIAAIDGFHVVNVVRSEAGAQRLRQAGAQVVIATQTADLVRAVHAVVPHGVDSALECVGGSLSTDVLRCLRPGGKMITYGSLAGQPLGFSPRDMIMSHSQLEGFYLPGWLSQQSLFRRLRLIRQVPGLIADGTLGTPVQETFTLDQIQQALAAAQRPGRTGKILLNIGES